MATRLLGVGKLHVEELRRLLVGPRPPLQAPAPIKQKCQSLFIISSVSIARLCPPLRL